jgi:hypothetical protein
MKHKAFLSMILVLMIAGFAVYPAFAQKGAGDGLGRVREATARFHNTRAVVAAGYNLVPGLDYCFDNPGVGGMGFHYINTALMDTKVDPLKPEAMVYAPGPSGQLQLGAVEYIVPAAAWDAANSQPPTLFGQTFGLNQALGVYALHAWIWKNNRLGVFSDWNPAVSCK